jgi:DDE superfamily endonuclease
LKEECDNHGVRLEFLPPYSPDFNPIEESFADLKAWLKRNRELIDSFDTFDQYLEAGLLSTGRNAPSHFHSCQIDVPRYLPKTRTARGRRIQREKWDLGEMEDDDAEWE